MYVYTCPAKRRRALVETNLPRDNRMGWRRISVWGGPFGSPRPPFDRDIHSYPQCLENSGGAGAEPPSPNQVDIFVEQLADILPEQ